MHRAQPRREALSSRLRAERGGIAADVIMFAFVMFVIMVTIQIALILHGRNVATAAAQDGLQAAQLDGGTETHGRVAARETLEFYDGIHSTDVDVVRTDRHVTITVTGEVSALVDGLFNSFNITLEGPVERFYQESDR